MIGKAKIPNIQTLFRLLHYNRIANRKKLILPLEKYFKTLKDMIIGTESFTIFQSGWNNGVKLWEFDEYPGAFPDKVNPDVILQMKQ